jgi:hypothetical protein
MFPVAIYVTAAPQREDMRDDQEELMSTHLSWLAIRKKERGHLDQYRSHREGRRPILIRSCERAQRLGFEHVQTNFPSSVSRLHIQMRDVREQLDARRANGILRRKSDGKVDHDACPFTVFGSLNISMPEKSRQN